MAGKAHIYYTFKVLTPTLDRSDAGFTVACMKWDEMEGSDELPVETYKIAPNNRTVVGGCSCPAWKWDCKHVRCVNEAIADGKLGELHRWRWGEKTGWVQMNDLHTDSWER